MTSSHGGRPKKPREVLALEGVTHKHRINDDAPEVREEPPVVPPWVADLPDEVRDRWMETWSHTCREAWWLKTADSQMLAQYVIAAVDAERLGRALMRSPILERDASNGGPKRLTVRREWLSAADTARTLAADFGLTTTTRQNLRAAYLGNDPRAGRCARCPRCRTATDQRETDCLDAYPQRVWRVSVYPLSVLLAILQATRRNQRSEIVPLRRTFVSVTTTHSTPDELDGLIDLADQLLDRLTQFRTEGKRRSARGTFESGLRNKAAAQPRHRITPQDV